MNTKAIVIQIRFDRLDTREPFQGLLDLVWSGKSEKAEALGHPLDVQRHRLEPGRRLLSGRFVRRRRALAATRGEEKAQSYSMDEAHAGAHSGLNHSRMTSLPPRSKYHVQKPIMNKNDSQVMTTVGRVRIFLT